MTRESSRPSITLAARPDGIYATNAARTERFEIKGVSWFGAEGNGACPDGLWQRPATAFLDDVSRLRFNALRIPLAVDNVMGDPVVDQWAVTANPAFRGLRSLAIVEQIVDMAAARGLLVMLDMHRLNARPRPHPLSADPASSPPGCTPSPSPSQR